MAYIGNPPAPQNITSAGITDGTIVNVDIASDAAIAATKIAGLSTVATTGAYSDVTGTPTIPVAGTDFVAQTGGTFTGNVDFADGVAARFGQSQDLSISHDGSNSYINELGDGDLVIQTNGNKIGLASSSPFEWMVEAVPNGSVTLSYNGSAKLATTNSGVSVSGHLIADDIVNIESTSGFAALEMGGPSGAFIDFKSPFTEDYDGRIQYDSGGDGAFIIATNGGNTSPVIIQQQGSEKLRTTATGVDVTGELVADSYNETYAAVTSSSNATTVNCEAGNTFSHTLTENTTFTFSNPPASGTAYSFSIEIIQDASASGYTVTWPTSVDWPAATAPTLTATASAKDIFVFTTRDGGTNWYGFTAGQALA